MYIYIYILCVLCIYISVEDLGLKWSFSGQCPQEKQWLLCSAAVSLLLYALQPAEYLQRGEYKVSASDEPQKQGNWQPLWGGKLVILPLIVYKFPQFPLHWSPLYLGCWEHPWVDEIGKWQLKTLCSEPWWPVLTEPINPSTTPFTIQHMWVYNHDHKQPHHERCCFWESTQSCISDWSIMWFYHVLSKYDAHQRVEMNVTILFWMCFFPVPIYLIFGYIWWNAYTESIWKDCFQVRAFTQKNMHPFEGDNVGKHSCPAGEELANPCHSRDFGSQTVSPGHYPLVI